MKQLIIIFTLFLSMLNCENHPYRFVQDNPYFSYQTMTIKTNGTLHFAVVMPEYFISGNTYPVLIAFPPGDQSRAMVEWEL